MIMYATKHRVLFASNTKLELVWAHTKQHTHMHLTAAAPRESSWFVIHMWIYVHSRCRLCVWLALLLGCVCVFYTELTSLSGLVGRGVGSIQPFLPYIHLNLPPGSSSYSELSEYIYFALSFAVNRRRKPKSKTSLVRACAPFTSKRAFKFESRTKDRVK